jgi:hypothetical protein
MFKIIFDRTLDSLFFQIKKNLFHIKKKLQDFIKMYKVESFKKSKLNS